MAKPIIFSGHMVRAILAGTKTQTRRLLKFQPRDATTIDWNTEEQAFVPWRLGTSTPSSGYRAGKPIKASYEVGSELWVKEAFRLRADQDDVPPRQDWWKKGAWYQADDETLEPSGCGGGAGKLRSSLFMPRWASRINLRVTALRVERLQAIQPCDVLAEGLERHPDGFSFRIPFQGDARPIVYAAPATAFASGWDHIHGSGAWDQNPWVWVISFERIAIAT